MLMDRSRGRGAAKIYLFQYVVGMRGSVAMFHSHLDTAVQVAFIYEDTVNLAKYQLR